MATNILENLKKAVVEFDVAAAANWAKQAMENKVDPLEALNALTEGIREIGDGYGRGEYFLPELVGAADAMQSAVPVIEEEIKKSGSVKKCIGKVVIGTVAGDIHTIGKGMVTSLLIARGFEVHDIGIDVPAEKFIESVDQLKPQILAMSALLSMTAPETKKVIDSLSRAGLRDKVKVMIGGGAITEDYAKMIGADGYSPTAPGAVNLAEKMLGVK